MGVIKKIGTTVFPKDSRCEMLVKMAVLGGVAFGVSRVLDGRWACYTTIALLVLERTGKGIVGAKRNAEHQKLTTDHQNLRSEHQNLMTEHQNLRSEQQKFVKLEKTLVGLVKSHKKIVRKLRGEKEALEDKLNNFQGVVKQVQEKRNNPFLFLDRSTSKLG